MRLLFAPELARGVLHASLWACLAQGEGRLRGRGLLCAAAEALFLPLLIPFVLVRATLRPCCCAPKLLIRCSKYIYPSHSQGMSYNPTAAADAELAGYDNCPTAVGRWVRDGLFAQCARLRRAVFHDLPLIDEHSARLLSAHTFAAAFWFFWSGAWRFCSAPFAATPNLSCCETLLTPAQAPRRTYLRWPKPSGWASTA